MGESDSSADWQEALRKDVLDGLLELRKITENAAAQAKADAARAHELSLMRTHALLLTVFKPSSESESLDDDLPKDNDLILDIAKLYDFTPPITAGPASSKYGRAVQARAALGRILANVV